MRLAPDEARRRFAAARVARLATVAVGGEPHLVPCTFAVTVGQIYVAVDSKPKTTRNLQRLRNIEAHPAVAMLADQYTDDWTTLWWARADGIASVTADPAAMAGPIRLLADRYPQYAASAPGGPLIVINVTRWSGWSAA